jgi:hypothetical protein
MRAAVGSNFNLLNIFSLNYVLLQRLQPKCHARMCAQKSADVDDKEATIFEAHSVNKLIVHKLPLIAAVGSNVNLPSLFSLNIVLLQRPAQEHMHSIQLILMRKKLLFKKGILPTYHFFHNLVMRAAVGSNINLPNIFSLNHVL